MKMHRQISISSVFLGLLIFCAYGEEILLQIMVKPINIVSDRYVSFAMEPSHLLELCSTPSNTENISILAQKLGSAYLKIAGSTTNTFVLDDETIPSTKNQVRITLSDWLALHEWINTTNLRPVIALPYSSREWSPRSIISILGMTSRLGIRNCVWQLGSELNTTDVINYVDDLGTFKTIVDTFRKNGNNWGIVSADIVAGCKADDIILYAELSKHISEANGWTQPTEHNSLEHDDNIFSEKDPTLRNLLKSKVPVWLNVSPPSHRSRKFDICDVECEFNGLRWAKTLGTSAQNSFNVVFKKINNNDLINPSFSYYVTILHKKIMGQKVFDTKVLNADKLSPQYYTHCTKNMSGSFAVMGVNFADFKTKVSTKLKTKYTGLELYQYVLNVDHGIVLLNGAPVNINSDLVPIIKIKRHSRPISFALPPRSVGFWVFPVANYPQCSTKSTDEISVDMTQELDMSPRTASENLLQELITEIVQNDSSRNRTNRSKRHTVVKKDSNHMKRIKRNADLAYKSRRDISLFKKFNDEAFTKRKMGLIARPRRRVPRQINNNNNGLGKLFKAFELPQPNKFKIMAKFWNLPSVKQNTIGQNAIGQNTIGQNTIGQNTIGQNTIGQNTIGQNAIAQNAIGENPAAVPPLTTVIHDVNRIDPNEQLFKSVENSELPTGDVFFQVGDEKTMDYVAFEEEKSENSGNNRNSNINRMDDQKYDDFDYVDAPIVSDHMYEFQPDSRGKKQSAVEISPYNELWESDLYSTASPSELTDGHDQFDDEQQRNIDMIVTEVQPNFRQNEENLIRAKSSLSTIYVNDDHKMPTLNMNLPMHSHDLNEDDFFISKRKKRSIDSKFNDEIEYKLNNMKKSEDDHAAYVEDYADNTIGLFEKIAKIIDSLEKMDDIGKYNNMEKLSADIKDLESFLFRRNFKLNVFKPKNRSDQKDFRKKCKILSINLEQQCLKENGFYPRRAIKRDANEQKSKVTSLKKVFAKEKVDKLNRVRRHTVWESSSWEADDRKNMILKEMYTANEAKFNNFVPSVSFRKPIYVDYQPNEEKKSFTEEIFVSQNLQQTNRPSVVRETTEQTKSVYNDYTRDQPKEMMAFTEQVLNLQKPNSPRTVQETTKEKLVPTFSINTNMLEGDLIDKDIDENHYEKEYRTPRFMNTISKSVGNWMNIVEKHVSGWWNLLS